MNTRTKISISLALFLATSIAPIAQAGTYTGSEGDDTIIGTNSADTINGRAGNDKLYGLDGDDYIARGSGNDTLEGCVGNDTLPASQVSPGNSALISILGGQGDDLVAFGGIPLPGSVVAGGSGIDIIQPSYGIGAGVLIDLKPFSGDFSFIKGFEVWDLDCGGSGMPCFDVSRRWGPPKLTNANVDGLERKLTIYMNSMAVDASAITSDGIVIRVRNAPNVDPRTDRCPVSGGEGDDVYQGTATVPAPDLTPDFFCGNGGNDELFGGDGIDTADFSGATSDYTVTEFTYNTLTVEDNRPGRGAMITTRYSSPESELVRSALMRRTVITPCFHANLWSLMETLI